MAAESLKIDDLNCLIKFFANQIIAKIEELEQAYRPDSRKKYRTCQDSLQVNTLLPN